MDTDIGKEFVAKAQELIDRCGVTYGVLELHVRAGKLVHIRLVQTFLPEQLNGSKKLPASLVEGETVFEVEPGAGVKKAAASRVRRLTPKAARA